MPKVQSKPKSGGMLPGLIASSVAVLNIYFSGFEADHEGLIGVLLPLAVFILVWGAYTAYVSESVEYLAKVGRYKKSIWVTVFSNLTGSAVAVGMLTFAMYAIGDELIAGTVGNGARLVWASSSLILSYLAYMAPGFLIALLVGGKAEQRSASTRPTEFWK